MPEELKEELLEFGVSGQAAEVIAGDKELAAKVSEALRGRSSQGEDRPLEAKAFANWLLHHREEAKSKTAKELIHQFQGEKQEIVGDASMLEGWVIEAIEKNPRAIADFKNGKESALQFLIGQVQKQAKGKSDVKRVAGILLERLK